MNNRTPLKRAIDAGKEDGYAKLMGGFAVAELTNGEIDYFPFGQPPNIHGERDSGARILARFQWNHVRWSRID